jgi:hypothetical protein
MCFDLKMQTSNPVLLCKPEDGLQATKLLIAVGNL